MNAAWDWLPWQKRLNERTERVVCVAAGRRIGKKSWLWRWLENQAFNCDGLGRAYLAPTQFQSKIATDAYRTNLGTGIKTADWRHVGALYALAIYEPAYCDPVLMRILMKRARFVRMAGTPRGRDHFWSRWTHGHMSGNWYSERVSTWNAGLVSREEILGLCETLPPDLRKQEFEAVV
ncbi:hypothetical protein LCGC14_0552460 [marine sediment metagenome]|uniref:Uncharacterized protein n=1 Tax=marine sediment metagenome TaxID=412755 RepID=A0A0F9UXU7_9ZZZZ